MFIHSQPKAISLSIDPGIAIRSKIEAFEKRHSILMQMQDVNLHESRGLKDAAYMYHVKERDAVAAESHERKSHEGTGH